MRILLSWLREYCDIQETPETIGAILTKAGIEVDHIETLSPQFKGVVCARIEEVETIGRGLYRALVFDGKNKHTVVCGAPNCVASLHTAYAPVGASLDGNTAIEGRLIEGIFSTGFLCSEKELALTEHGEGIVEFGKEVAPGTPIDAFFQDVAFDVTITPNLGSCLSILGIARELSAFTGIPLKKKPWLDPEPSFPTTSILKASSNDLVLIPRYSALMVDSVKVMPTRTKMRVRLERCGIRSINNVVDITNYVSHEFGLPMHAFDAAQVANSHLIARKSAGPEKMLFLDDVERVIPENSIVIADANGIVALGGIMGGKASSVTDETKQVIFEAAHFQPAAIRKTSRKIGIQTDSSRRFERGCDQNITLHALKFAYELLKNECPDVVLVGAVDAGAKRPYRTVTCRLSRTSAILGYTVSVSEMESAFTKLFFIASWDGQDLFTVQVPGFRHDIVDEIDLIEEVGRLVGLEGPPGHRPVYSASVHPHDPLYLFTNEVRNRLVAEGLQEMICCDLISDKMANVVLNHQVTPESLVAVLNPLSVDQSVMRPSLLPGLLDCLHRNIAHRRLSLHAFEIGCVHLKDKNGYQEPLCFGLILSGKAFVPHYSSQARDVDFFDVKGMLENLFSALGFYQFELRHSALSILHPGRQAKIYLSNVHVGVIGELHPALLRQFGIEQRAYFAECDMQELVKLERKIQKMHPLAQFPSSERDWTITLAKSVPMNALFAKIYENPPPILEHVELTSIFEHEKLGNEFHNVTLHFVYRDREKTVSQEEVDKAHNELTSCVGASFTGI